MGLEPWAFDKWGGKYGRRMSFVNNLYHSFRAPYRPLLDYCWSPFSDFVGQSALKYRTKSITNL